MRVLVTGGCGFIGGNLCRRLVADGHDVVVLDDLSTGRRANIEGLDLELRIDSILDARAVQAAARDADSILHLAGVASVQQSMIDPATTHDVNVNGTVNVLLAARESNAHLVFASSSAVYGQTVLLPTREDCPPQPESPYAASKLAAEAYVLSFARAYDMSTLAFRFFNVYGRLQSSGYAGAAVVPSFLSALVDGRPIVVQGDGNQSRDFVSVAAVVDVLTDAIVRRVVSPFPVNLAFGERTTVLELVRLLEELTGTVAQIEHEEARPGDVRDSQADCQLFRSLFPGTVTQSLRAGMSDAVSWFAHEQLAST